MVKRTYTSEEIARILEELQITPLDGMVDSQQAARILSKRAELETGMTHTYRDDAIRWRSKTGKLPIARAVNNRLNLFWIEDIFNLDLEPQKWHSVRSHSKRGKSSGPSDEEGRSISVTPHIAQLITASLVA